MDEYQLQERYPNYSLINNDEILSVYDENTTIQEGIENYDI
ncbi:MAG: hypothetical protein ACTSVV_10505 [Promethearchaeota archaeon]